MYSELVLTRILRNTLLGKAKPHFLGKASRAVLKVVAFGLGRDSATRRGIGNPFALCYDFLLIAFDDGTDCALDRLGEEHVSAAAIILGVGLNCARAGFAGLVMILLVLYALLDISRCCRRG